MATQAGSQRIWARLASVGCSLGTLSLLGVCAAAPLGLLDTEDGDRKAWGWACDPDAPDSALTVHFYFDLDVKNPGKELAWGGTTRASQPREGIAGACGGAAAHGFSWTIPELFRRPGNTYALYAHAVDPKGRLGPPLRGSPRRYSVPDGLGAVFFKEITYKRVVRDPEQICALRMRIYRDSTAAAPGHFKPLLMLHAGGWQSGGFDSLAQREPPVARPLIPPEEIHGFASRGYVVFVPEHRLIGKAPSWQAGVDPHCQDAKWHEVVEDVETALRMVYLRGPEPAYGGTIPGSKVGLVGHSSGAHLALWLTYSPSAGALFGEGAQRSADLVQRTAALAAPSDFGDAYAGRRGALGLVQAFCAADGGDCMEKNSFFGKNKPATPVFLAHGKEDETVPWQQSEGLARSYYGSPWPVSSMDAFRTVRARGDHRFHLLDYAGHAQYVPTCSAYRGWRPYCMTETLRRLDDTLTDMYEWMDAAAWAPSAGEAGRGP